MYTGRGNGNVCLPAGPGAEFFPENSVSQAWLPYAALSAYSVK